MPTPSGRPSFLRLKVYREYLRKEHRNNKLYIKLITKHLRQKEVVSKLDAAYVEYLRVAQQALRDANRHINKAMGQLNRAAIIRDDETQKRRTIAYLQRKAEAEKVTKEQVNLKTVQQALELEEESKR